MGQFLEPIVNANIAQLVNDVGQVIDMVVAGAKDIFLIVTEYPANVFMGLSVMGIVIGFASRFIRR